MTKSNKKYILFGLISIVFTIALYFIGMTLIAKFINNAIASTIVDIIFKMVIGIGIIFLLKFVLKISHIGLGYKGIIYGLFIYGAMAIVYIILNYISGISEFDRTFMQALPYLVLFFFMCLGIGFVEEMIFRGIVLNFFKKLLCNHKCGVVVSIIISSVLFGMCHLLNLISTPNMIVSTIVQVLYASIIGAYFAVIYIKSGNIWAPIILHTVFDYVYYIWFAFSNEAIINAM
ncbi:MAG: CPBP family intramembrane metalloprotease, partial [Clostridia bacterium]|nr:CPBP family intramembrane metalloprotease [Clostridia bacterium]